jgi:hypothetical protein
MSDLIKVQNTPQFSWYTRWTSLGANGTSDKLIKEGLKQLNCIKISFEKGAKEITGHVAPDQTQLDAEYFLPFKLPNLKPKKLTQLSYTQKDDGPTLFNLMGKCFEDVGLTK